MSGQVTITQLPVAGALAGTESVPIVQNGVTVQTTTGAIAGAGALNYPFLTVGSTAGLTQARYLTTSSGLSLTDGGAGTTLQINLTGAAQSLNGAGNGFMVKTGANTLINRLLTVGGGMTIANADGIAGNPLIGLNANLQALASLSGIGLMTINGSTFSQTTLLGTTNSITISNGNASSGNPTIAISNNPVLTGTGGVQVPTGTTAQRLANNGVIRYNSDTSRFEFYEGGTWVNVGIGDGTVTYVNGTANQIQITNPTTTPTISLVANPTLPGNAFVQLPIGTTAQRGTPTYGALRYNTDINLPEIYTTSGWGVLPSGTGISTFSAGATGLTPSTPSTGGIVLGGILNAASGGTGLSSPAANSVLLSNGSSALQTVAPGPSGYVLTSNGTTWVSAPNGGGGAGVSSVGLSAPSIFTVTGSPVTSIGTLTLSYSGSPLPVANGGTGLSSTPANGALDIGNGTGFTRTTLTAGLGITVTNASGSITIASSVTPVTSVTGTAPVVSSGGTTPAISMAAATTSVNGYLTSTDWNTFNNKQPAGSYLTAVTADAPLSGSGTSGSHLVIAQANTTTSGYLSSTDWNTFNGKQASLVSGTNIKTVAGVSLLGSGDVGLIGGTYGGTGVNNGASTITVAGNLSHAGAFTQTFTATANTALTLPTSGTLISTVTNMAANPVTGTPSSTTFLRGDGTWASPVGSGTVTSVAQSFTGGLISVAGSPITSSGTLALTVAGTSGGIPYFSSGTTWASSAVLTASALMVGGGAGVAPSTITTGTGVVTALGVNTGSTGAFVVNGGALGTPSSGTVTNLTGTASININGTVGATTANTGAFTTLSASSTVSGTGFSTYLASPPAIGGTTAGTGAFTTLGATGVFTASAGTSALPSIVTSSGSTSGLYSSTANVLGIAISAASVGTFTATGLNGMAVGATTTSTGAFTTLSASSTVSGTGFSTYLASPPAIGGTAAAAGTFTTLAATTVQYATLQPVIATTTTGTTITPDGTKAQYNVTALASATTIAAPSGTPTDGQKLIIRFKDNGTAWGLTWTVTSGAYRAVGVTLPTTTVPSKVLYVGCIYNAQDTFWDVVAVAEQ